jgi:Mn-dependent DtxR family transcriptional regulator
MSKEMWIAEHERLIEEYLNDHPDADWSEAYERTADSVDERLRDRIAAMADDAKMRAKYGE